MSPWRETPHGHDPAPGSEQCPFSTVGFVSAHRSPSCSDGVVSRQGSSQSISDTPWWTCHKPSAWPISCTRLSVLPASPNVSGFTRMPPAIQTSCFGLVGVYYKQKIIDTPDRLPRVTRQDATYYAVHTELSEFRNRSIYW